MLIYILILLALLCLIDIIRVIVLICAVAMSDRNEVGGHTASLIWRILSLGAKITALVFVILLL